MAKNNPINPRKKVLLSCALFGLLSCTSPTLARRDYQYYPSHKKEIALYNIEQILGDICDESKVTPEYLFCDDVYLKWDEIEYASCEANFYPERTSLKTKSISGLSYPFIAHLRKPFQAWRSAKQQCYDLEEAINIYLKERKK